MLKRLKIRNLTVFPEADLRFSPALNVIIGINGTGKTHLLKTAYTVLATSAEEGRKPSAGEPTKVLLQPRLADKLVRVMRPESLGRLARRRQGRERCEIAASFEDAALDMAFSFATNSKTEVSIEQLPRSWLDKAPVYLPTRELLTLYPNFVAMYDSHYLEFDETYRDTCVLLGAPAVRGPRETKVGSFMRLLEEAMGGKVHLEKNGRFYLINQQGKLEMPLVAEGVRKLAMIARLIATGSLLDKGYLFWDEPETNLNPQLIKEVAKIIHQLTNNGIQVFIATHSLFLLRELEILLNQYAEMVRFFGQEPTKPRFFGLQPGTDGITVQQGSTIEAIDPIAALDEALEQSDRYLSTA